VGIVVSVTLLVVAGRNVDFDEAVTALSEVSYGLYAVSLLFYFGTVVVRALLVKVLLGFNDRVTYRSTLTNLILGYFANNILPLKIGEVVRTGLIAREARMSFWTCLSALIIERSMDVATILVIAVGISFLLPLPAEVVVSVRAVGVLLLVLYVGFVALAVARKRGWTVHERLISRLPGVGSWAERTLRQFAAGLDALSTPSGFVKTVLLVVLFWVVAVSGWYLRLRAFGLAEDPVIAPFVVVVVGLGVSVPSAPSYAGVMHALIVFALAAFGIDSDRSFPFAVFLHAVDFLFIGLIGTTVMAAKSMSFARLREAARPAGHARERAP
jgi:hypothetical protein